MCLQAASLLWLFIDTVSRLVRAYFGIQNPVESAETESFENGLLEYPRYTKTEVF